MVHPLPNDSLIQLRTLRTPGGVPTENFWPSPQVDDEEPPMRPRQVLYGFFGWTNQAENRFRSRVLAELLSSAPIINGSRLRGKRRPRQRNPNGMRSEEHTSELQSLRHLV